MDAFETETQVFIVRVWLEPRESPLSRPEWRGVIEHVLTHQRQYFNDLATVPTFIMPYLEASGVKPDLRWRVRRYLRRWKLFQKVLY